MATEDGQEFVPVFGVRGARLELPAVDATVLLSLLQSAGIDAALSHFPGLSGYTAISRQVLVPEAQVEEANRIIAEALAAGPSAAEQAELEGEAAGDAPPGDVNAAPPGVF